MMQHRLLDALFDETETVLVLSERRLVEADREDVRRLVNAVAAIDPPMPYTRSEDRVRHKVTYRFRMPRAERYRAPLAEALAPFMEL